MNKIRQLSIVSLFVSASAMSSATELFTEQQARDNLDFAAMQYLKMLDHMEAGRHLHKETVCSEIPLCLPRAQENDAIHMVSPQRWVVGFYPGLLWMLSNHAEHTTVLQVEDNHQRILDNAIKFSELLFEQADRNDTHDLGFMIEAPLGFALQNKHVEPSLKKDYLKAIETAEAALMQRVDDTKGVMKSWDFVPRIHAHMIDKTGNKSRAYLDLRSPWAYPVIVDNMMNMEILLKSDEESVKAAAFKHADTTMEHHFFYAIDDKEKQRPIAYHVFDYGEMKPGNWQGLGNKSAWARGQGWALYGYVVSTIYASEDTRFQHKTSAYEQMVEKIVDTIDHYTQKDPIPQWDFFASRSDAHEIAAYTGSDTARYSQILDLCIETLPQHVLPYQGYSPIELPTDLFADSTLKTLAQYKNLQGSDYVNTDGVFPCGQMPYDLQGRDIPYDTSAAALYSAALYRMAQHLGNTAKSRDYEKMADRFMHALSGRLRADAENGDTYKLGFVLQSATGHLPNAMEVDTAIVYADYYFVEASWRKLALLTMRQQ